MSENKSFGVALVFWFFFGGLGGHRIYIQEKMSVILWYWLATICTLGLLPWIDLFFIKGLLDEANKNN